MKPAMIIRFDGKPQGLEGVLKNLSGIRLVAPGKWIWDCPIGDIQINSTENPYTLEISAQSNAHVTQSRINIIANRVASCYPNCKKEIDKSYFSLAD